MVATVDDHGLVLAVDFGTSNTVAMLRRPDGQAEAVLFDGSPVLASAVFVQPDGQVLAGRDAIFSARLAPERYEPNPKLRIDDGTVWLGVEVAVVDLIAAVLGRVAAEARRSGGFDRVVLTHPAAWGSRRTGVLANAAERAGLTPLALVPEPVAAARYAAEQATQARSGAPMVIYDLGAGTFDVSVVAGGRVLATDGIADLGGLDIDDAILDHLGAVYRERDPDAWDRLRSPDTAEDRRAWRALADDVRTAKEMLSRTAQAYLHLPLIDRDAPIGRDEIEALARPLIERTVETTRRTMAASGTTAAGVFLVGGASRMPLVATMLHRALRTAPIVTAQPELAVAHGALTADAGPDARRVALTRLATAMATEVRRRTPAATRPARHREVQRAAPPTAPPPRPGVRHGLSGPVVFQQRAGHRATGGAKALGLITAVLTGILTVLDLLTTAASHGSVPDALGADLRDGVLLTGGLALVGLVVGIAFPYQVLTVGPDSLTVERRGGRSPSTKTAGWQRIQRVRVVGSDAEARIVIWQPDAPIPYWQSEPGGGWLVCRITDVTERAGQLDEIRAILARAAGDRYQG